MPKLSLEDFAAQCLWYEHIRLSAFISEFEERKHFRKTLLQIRRGDVGLAPHRNGGRTEWHAMVEGWYQHYLEQANV